MISLFLVTRLKLLCFLTLEDCGEVGDPTDPLEFQSPPGIWTHVFLSSQTRFFQAFEVHRASHVSVEDHLYLPATAANHINCVKALCLRQYALMLAKP